MEKIDLKHFKRGRENKNKTINLTEKNYKKLKKLNVNLSAIVNDYLRDNDKKFLELEYNEILENNQNRIVTTVLIEAENIPKIVNVKLTYLVNSLIERF
jgi:hypothetical protein